jgi:hypothetical protein
MAADSRQHVRLGGNSRPWGALLLALVLLTVGVVALGTWSLIMLGVLGAHWADSALPLLVVGLLGGIPGVYETSIAYATYKGWPGYSYAQIPRYTD